VIQLRSADSNPNVVTAETNTNIRGPRLVVQPVVVPQGRYVVSDGCGDGVGTVPRFSWTYGFKLPD
jgi:hypothetical protein